MSFQPDADPNFQAYLKQRNRLDANLAENFDQGFIEYLCSQATATGTINLDDGEQRNRPGSHDGEAERADVLSERLQNSSRTSLLLPYIVYFLDAIQWTMNPLASAGLW